MRVSKRLPSVPTTCPCALSMRTCWWCTRRRFECIHGGVLNLPTKLGVRQSKCVWSYHLHQTFTESNQWIRPIKSLRIGEEQHVQDSPDHSWRRCLFPRHMGTNFVQDVNRTLLGGRFARRRLPRQQALISDTTNSPLSSPKK